MLEEGEMDGYLQEHDKLRSFHWPLQATHDDRSHRFPICFTATSLYVYTYVRIEENPKDEKNVQSRRGREREK